MCLVCGPLPVLPQPTTLVVTRGKSFKSSAVHNGDKGQKSLHQRMQDEVMRENVIMTGSADPMALDHASYLEPKVQGQLQGDDEPMRMEDLMR